MNITSLPHGVSNIINENFNLVKNINEQGFSSFKKVESFGKSYMVSCVSKALLVSVPLHYVGFSFSTVFPICIALIVATSLINLAKDNIKAAMNALAKKIMHYLRQISEVITHIFHKICACMNSFTLVTVNLIKERSFAANSNKNLQINYATVSNQEAFEEELLMSFASLTPITLSATILEETSELISPVCILEETPQIKEDTQIVILPEFKKEIHKDSTTEKEEPRTSILSKYEQACSSSQFFYQNSLGALNLNTETAPEMPKTQTFVFKNHNFNQQKEQTALPFSRPPGQTNPAAALLKTIGNSKNPLLKLAITTKCPAVGSPRVKIPLQVAGVIAKALAQNIA